MLGWLAGMRVGEIAALNVGDVVAADGEVRTEIHLTAAKRSSKRNSFCIALALQLNRNPFPDFDDPFV